MKEKRATVSLAVTSHKTSPAHEAIPHPMSKGPSRQVLRVFTNEATSTMSGHRA